MDHISLNFDEDIRYLQRQARNDMITDNREFFLRRLMASPILDQQVPLLSPRDVTSPQLRWPSN